MVVAAIIFAVMSYFYNYVTTDYNYEEFPVEDTSLVDNSHENEAEDAEIDQTKRNGYTLEKTAQL